MVESTAGKGAIGGGEQQRTFKGDASQAAFLIGGIGTGNFSIGSRGEMRDWEIFNRPAKGGVLPYTFFSIWAKAQGAEAVTRILESELQPPFTGAHGSFIYEVAGLPRLDSSEMRGEYPFVWVTFTDQSLPVQVRLEAFNPFIPLNADDSGIPAGIIRYRVANRQDKPVEVTIAGSFANAAAFDGYERARGIRLAGPVANEFRTEGTTKGLFLRPVNLPEQHRRFGNLAILTSAETVTVKEEWVEGGFCDGIFDFWGDLQADGRLERRTVVTARSGDLAIKNQGERPRVKFASLGICHTLQPGEERTFEFVVAWYFPNRAKEWDEFCGCATGECATVRNYYGTLFRDAWQAGSYLFANMERLERFSREFHRALFGTTLPPYVIDALASNLTVIRSTTCFRIEDGTLLAYEGCNNDSGCCFGSCTHVWNYAQSMAFLFPQLERSMRLVDFNLETDDKGMMAFRSRQVFGKDKWDFLPAADGQLGTIIRLYREWKISGDDDFLKSVWAKAVKALEFAFTYWDTDGDCVLDGKQHVDYDIEFYGPNSLTNSLFYGALKAAAEMATHLGERDRAARYREALERGSRRMDQLLWNGEYYIQKLDNIDDYRYQYGEGCLSDQLLGQLMAHVAGLGYVLPEDHVKKAIHSVFRHNFRSGFREHHNLWRAYAHGNEEGLLLASWPHGRRPRYPFFYADEVWTGIEYHVAAHLIYEGYVDEGLRLVKAVRDRHDGYRRNPWNEVECGNHYARTLASWALLTALSGFTCDLVHRRMEFKPVISPERFSTFWSTGRAWGIYEQTTDAPTGRRSWNVQVLYGDLHDVEVNGERVGA